MTTLQWKKELSERKGHRIHLLHVGDSEVDILAKALSYLYNVTSKADECVDFIEKKRKLAENMMKEYEHWADACESLEDTFTKTIKGQKSGKQGSGHLDYNDDNDTDERKRSPRAKTPPAGSRDGPDTVAPDTVIGYGPPDDTNVSGYNQLQLAALSSHPPPLLNPQPRRQPSFIDLESYNLSTSQSATPIPGKVHEKGTYIYICLTPSVWSLGSGLLQHHRPTHVIDAHED